MKFNRFYNIHIPKNGGTYFRENILRPCTDYLNKNGIQTTPEGGGGYGVNDSDYTLHWAWYDEFTHDDSYIFVTLRDPSKRIVSHYAWQAFRAINDGLSNYTYDDITVKNFYKWLDVFYYEQKNFQSKNLVYFNSDKTIYKQSKHLGWKDNDVPRVKHFMFDEHFKNFKINEYQLDKNIKKCNLIVKSENLREMNFQQKTLEKIFIDLNLQNPVSKIDPKVYGNSNNFSKILYSKLSNKEIDDLYLMSSLDTELYFYNDIFTKI
jgi:hypothetical protein